MKGRLFRHRGAGTGADQEENGGGGGKYRQEGATRARGAPGARGAEASRRAARGGPPAKMEPVRSEVMRAAGGCPANRRGCVAPWRRDPREPDGEAKHGARARKLRE